MATFTFGTLSTSLIPVTSGTGTLSQLYDDLYAAAGDAETYIAKTGVDPYVYEIQGNRELDIYGGVTLNMSNDGDELRWTLTSNMSRLFYCRDGSIFTATDDCIINFDSNNGNYARWYNSGHTTLNGSYGHPIIIKRYYENRFYQRSGNDPHNWDYVEMQDPSSYSTSNSAFYFSYESYENMAHSFTNISFSNMHNSGYLAIFNGGDWSNSIFDNWNSVESRCGFDIYGVNVKFTNSSFDRIYSCNYIRSNGGIEMYGDGISSQAQPKITFDNCTFTDAYAGSSDERWGYAYGAFVKFKDCTFQGVTDAMSYGVYGSYYSKFLYEGTTTFTNVTTHRVWQSGGQHLYVRSLDMNVKDSNGNPIQNAIVSITHSLGNEYWMFKTDSNGSVKDCFGDNPVFIEKEETSTDNFTQWSDSISDGRYHLITITNLNSNIWQRKVEFTSDIHIDAQLSTAGGPRLLSQT